MLGGSFDAGWAGWDGTAFEDGDAAGTAPGCGNSSKERTDCGLPSSVTWKSCWLRPFTEWPLESVTTTSSTTMWVERRKVIGGASASDTAGPWGERCRIAEEAGPEASGDGAAAATLAVDACASRADSSAASTDANVVSSGDSPDGSWETGASSPGTSAFAAMYLA